MKPRADSPGAAAAGSAVLTLAAMLLATCALCLPLRAEPQSFGSARPTAAVVTPLNSAASGCAVAIIDGGNPFPDNDGFDSPAPLATHLLAGNDESASHVLAEASRDPAPSSQPPPLAIPLLC